MHRFRPVSRPALWAMLAGALFGGCASRRLSVAPREVPDGLDGGDRAARALTALEGIDAVEVRRTDAWLVASAPAPAPQGEAEGGSGDLAKAAQNPVANMISLPFQNNSNFDVGPDDKFQNVLNVQPVIPISLSCRWNLITRTIIPIVYDEAGVFPGVDEQFGLGDVTATAFLSPAQPGKLIWGVGPALLLPTASKDVLGTGKWGAGPSVVLLSMPGHWVLGAIASNIWSFAGDEDRGDVDLLTLQPFVNYNLEGGWYLTFSPIVTADWEADADQRWTVPLGGGVGRVFKMGCQPVNVSLSAYYNVERPDFAPESSLRFQFTFLFPTGGKK